MVSSSTGGGFFQKIWRQHLFFKVMKQLGPGEKKNQKVITPIGLGKSHNGSWVRIVVRGKSLRISNNKDVFQNITRKIRTIDYSEM